MKEIKNILFFIKYIKPQWKTLLTVIVLTIVATGIGLYLPIINSNLVDKGILAKNFDYVLNISIIYTLAYVVKGFIGLLISSLTAIMNSKIRFKMNQDVFKEIERFKLSYFQNNDPTMIYNNITTDINNVSKLFDGNLLNVFTQMLYLIGGITCVFMINYKLALVAIAIIPIKYFSINFFSKKNKVLTKEYLSIHTDYARWFQDTIQGIKAIDIFYNQLNGKVGHIIFTGGEPILNFPLIKKIVNYVKQSNYKMTYMIKTNGTLIDEDIMFFLMDNDFDVQISLDGCREANDMNRVYMNQEGSYEDVIKVINKFVENGYKDKLSIHGTVTHQTIQYLRDSLKMMRTEYKGILFEIKEVMGSSESQFLLTNDDQKEYLRCQLDEQISDDFTQGDFLKNRYVCGIGMWHISVDTNGELYPCYRLSGKKEFKMGNVSDGKFVKSKNHKLNEIYNLYKNPNCQKCYSINSCTTGCYADKLLMDEKQLCELSYRNYIEEYLTEYFSDINKVALLPQI